MVQGGLRGATGWLGTGLALAALAFALLVFARLDWAIYAGLAASLALVASGLRVSSVLERLPDDERIAYPYHLAQRGRRMAWTALAAALGIAGYTIAGDLVAGRLGPTALIVAGSAALLAPPTALVLAVWTVDGIALRTGFEDPGDPLIGATLSLTLALILAVLTAVTGYGVSFALLVAFGGLVPCLFLLWSLQRIRAALARPRVEPLA